MALKRLSIQEMVQLSLPWVTDGTGARSAILAVPELVGLLPKVEAGHNALHATQPAADDPRLAQIQAEEAGLDLRHDAVLRGIYMLLSALALLVGEGPEADALIKLRDFLLPDGLEATQQSYRAEAGAGSLLTTRLAGDPAVQAQLKTVPVLKYDLSHYVGEWLTVAKKLGELEDERGKIEGAAGPSDAAKQLAARNMWIRAVNALTANADLAELDSDAQRLIFGALRLAERKADLRGKGTRAAPPPPPPAEPVK